jgi:hypothetical protein
MNLTLGNTVPATWKRTGFPLVAAAAGLTVAVAAALSFAASETPSALPVSSSIEGVAASSVLAQPLITHRLVGTQAQADQVNQAQAAVLQGGPLPASIAIPLVVESETEAQQVLQAGMHAAMAGNGSPPFLVIDARR